MVNFHFTLRIIRYKVVFIITHVSHSRNSISPVATVPREASTMRITRPAIP